MSYQYLSYFLSEETPGYGGKPGFKRVVVKNMCSGDSCNQQEWTFSNHIGTHIDCPKHFSKDGRSIEEYPADFWVCDKVAFKKVSVDENNLLIQLEGKLEDISSDVEFIIIKTGFCDKRFEQAYWERGPGIHPDSGAYLRSKFKSLRYIGFDFISLTSYQHRQEGRVAHRYFLDPSLPGNPILIIEDMDLRNIDKSPVETIVAPLQVEKADGCQVNIMAKF